MGVRTSFLGLRRNGGRFTAIVAANQLALRRIRRYSPQHLRRMSMYLWQDAEWPRFRWDAEALLTPLGEARHRQGRFLGRVMQLGFDLKLEAELQATTEDVMKTSAIEGEQLDFASVRS